MCAEPSLSGPAVVAYADTLIRATFNLDREADSVIWTKKVPNPEAYGVVKMNEKREIVELVEKPSEFVSDQAVIGIYYFKDIGELKAELQYVLENNIINGGEYQINDGILRYSNEYWRPDNTVHLTATVTGSGYLAGWMDWNGEKAGSNPLTPNRSSCTSRTTSPIEV